MNYKIANIHRGKGSRREIVYAELRDENDELCISATLEYIVGKLNESGFYIPFQKGEHDAR